MAGKEVSIVREEIGEGQFLRKVGFQGNPVALVCDFRKKTSSQSARLEKVTDLPFPVRRIFTQ